MKLQEGKSIVVDVAGAAVSMSAALVTEMFLDRLRAQSAPAELLSFASATLIEQAPPIGSTWHGGTYAGIARGEEGAPDYHVIVMEQHPERLGWHAAVDWATSLGGDELFALPTRRELALCFANVPEIFEKTWYWSREQYAGDEAYAWYQFFDLGGQGYGRKDYELRARAVRRLTL